MNLRDFEKELHLDNDPGIKTSVAVSGIRSHLGLTQKQLGELMGTSQSDIARAESSEHPVTVSWLCRLAKAIDKDLHISFKDSTS